jgi:hypothetical protein
MWTTFAESSSPLGIGAIRAQNVAYSPPAATDHLTYGEWFERYLKPLSETDLIADHIRRNAKVAAIGKVELRKSDCPSGDLNRGNWDFRLLLFDFEKVETEWIATADIVFDCGGREVGRYGHGGLLAPMERFWHGPSIAYEIPDPGNYSGKSVLVAGDQPETAELIVQLCRLDPAAKITWITPREPESPDDVPLGGSADDTLPARRSDVEKVHRLVQNGVVTWWPGVWIERLIDVQVASVTLELSGGREGEYTFDALISQSGNSPDWTCTSELQLDICPITDAPRPFSEYLRKRPSPYSVEYPAPDPAALITSEPNYYVLGSKSFGRIPGFLYQHGLRQIRDVFTIIGDRADLDLYAQMK